MPPSAVSMRAASWALMGSTSLSAWWFIGSPHSLHIILLLALVDLIAMPPPLLIQRDVVAPVAQGLCHPDQFLQELVGAADVGLLQQLAGFVKDLAHVAEVDVPEDGHQPEFTQHGQEVLDHARPTERPRRDSRDACRLVDVLLQAA